VRADGIALAASGAATLAFDLDAPLAVDVTGAPHDDSTWTGSTTPVALAANLLDDCTDWSDANPVDSGWIGDTDSTQHAGFARTKVSCNQMLHVYCLEQ
jgi:hypothetical protein